MNESIRAHYQGLFRKHGDAAQAVQYHDTDSQFRRFRVLAEIASDLGSVVDVGCGLGHFHDAITASGYSGPYLGLDFVEDFIEHGRRKHAGNPQVEFRRFDMGRDEYPAGYDTFVICGVFNNRAPDNRRFMEETLAKAFSAAGKRLAFNAMSTYVDFQDEGLYYADPLAVFDFCKRLTRRVVLRHDYLVRDDRPPFEYTMYLYK